jgi:hypothetical protein
MPNANALTGRTHSKWVTVKVDNSGGTLTDISAYVNTVGTLGMTFDTQDVTAFSDEVKNIVLGQPAAAITLGGPIDTTLIAHVTAICGTGTPLSVDIQLGIRHAYEEDEPQWGISMTTISGYLCNSFVIDPSANTWTAGFDVYGVTAPAWGITHEH